MIVSAALATTGCTASGPVTGTGSSAAATTSSAAVTGSGAPATESTAAAAESECTNAELAISTGAIQAAAGHYSLSLYFIDNSETPCFVQGYPGVAVALPADGTYNAERTMTGYMGGDNAQSPTQISLGPGGSAAALIEWVDSPQNGSDSFSAADCTGYGASSLLVTAPDQTTSQTVPNPAPNWPVCWGFEVHPIVPGSTGQFPTSAAPSS